MQCNTNYTGDDNNLDFKKFHPGGSLSIKLKTDEKEKQNAIIGLDNNVSSRHIVNVIA